MKKNTNSRNAVVEVIPPITKSKKSTAKVVTGKKAVAPKPKGKKAKVVEQGRTFEGSAVREKAHERVKELGLKKTDALETLCKAAMAKKREYYGAKASDAGVKVIAAAAEALDAAVAKFGKAIKIPDLSINLAKDIARDWKCFDAE